MESQVFMRSAAASFAGHMVLAAGLLFAEAHPFDYVPPQSIAVDIVSPTEVPSAKEIPPEPPKKATDAFDIPDDKPSADTKAAAAAPKPSEPPQAAPAPAPSPDAPTPSASKQAALQPPQQPQPPQPVTPPTYQAPEPDITVKYGVLLGLPTTTEDNASGGAAEATKANISAMDTAEFRRRLKTCSKLPASISPGDNIRIVLRVPFTTDGKIAAPPALIEASASMKGPDLMKGAVAALVACQPYAMLPADKYNEWKVLDLSFTPSDFVGG